MLFTTLLFSLLGLVGLTQLIQRNTGRDRSLWSNSYLWFALFWLVQMLLLVFPLFAYFEPMTVATGTYIFLAHLAFSGGAIIVMTLTRVPPPQAAVTSEIVASRSFLNGSLIVGSLSQVILSINVLLGTGISISQRMNTNMFQKARLANFDSNVYFLGPLSGPITVLSSLCYVGIAYFAFFWGRGERWTRRISIESLLALMTIAILFGNQIFISAGRIALVFVGVVVMVSASLGRSTRPDFVASKRSIPRTLTIVAIVIALSVVSAMFQDFRTNKKEDPLKLLAFAHGASISSDINIGLRSDRLFGFYMLQVSYLTSSTNILNFYLELPGREFPGPFYGAYDFPQIYQYAGRFFPGFDPFFWQKDREHLFAPISSQGRLGNVWSTMVRDLVADFGRGGALGFLFAFGAICQLATDGFRRNPTASRASIVAILRLLCGFSALVSLFFQAWVVWALLVLFVAALWPQQRGSTPPPRRVQPRQRVQSPAQNSDAFGSPFPEADRDDEPELAT